MSRRQPPPSSPNESRPRFTVIDSSLLNQPREGRRTRTIWLIDVVPAAASLWDASRRDHPNRANHPRP